MKLKRCPCGQTPESLRWVEVEDARNVDQHFLLVPSCCSTWVIAPPGFGVYYHENATETDEDTYDPAAVRIETDEERAVRVWNTAPSA